MFFSIIIPHRDSVTLLQKLLSSIPDSNDIEIIVVDNSKCNITKEIIGVSKDYQLLYSSSERGAGGARNVGLERAKGKWIIFADADDYFSESAFDLFFSMLNSDADVIYSCAEGKYIDTGEYSTRADPYNNLIKNFIAGRCTELDLRLGIPVPWCKMIRRELIEMHHIRFDEIIAGNDIYFSLLVGYYAHEIAAVDAITYIVTVSKGTLTKRRDFDSTYARLYSKLHCNQFLKEHDLSKRQHSIMFAFSRGKHYKLSQLWTFVLLIVKYRQNPFVGYTQWLRTFFKRSKDKKYITK